MILDGNESGKNINIGFEKKEMVPIFSDRVASAVYGVDQSASVTVERGSDGKLFYSQEFDINPRDRSAAHIRIAQDVKWQERNQYINVRRSELGNIWIAEKQALYAGDFKKQIPPVNFVGNVIVVANSEEKLDYVAIGGTFSNEMGGRPCHPDSAMMYTFPKGLGDDAIDMLLSLLDVQASVHEDGTSKNAEILKELALGVFPREPRLVNAINSHFFTEVEVVKVIDLRK